jgi:endonuclease YncB( thermonuclease family)
MDIEKYLKEFEQYGRDTPTFSLNGIQTYARVCDVYDGDSLHVVIPLFDTYYRFPLRLSGVDTCELRSANDTLVKLAVKARNRVIQWISKALTWEIESLQSRKEIQQFFESKVHLIWIDCLDFDKFGRVLANVKLRPNDDQTLADVLIQEKLAYAYEGGTRLSEDELTEYFS